MKFKLMNEGASGVYWYTEQSKTKKPTELSAFSFKLSESTPFGYAILKNKNITKTKVKSAVDKFMKQAIDRKKGSFLNSVREINLR